MTQNIGAYTEWDSLKEIIVGGYDVIFPAISERERDTVRKMYTPEEAQWFIDMGGKAAETDAPELYQAYKREVGDLVAVLEGLGVKVHQPRKHTPADVALFGAETGFFNLFPRDMFVVHGDKIIHGSMPQPTLQKCQQAYIDIMRDKADETGAQWISVPVVNFEFKAGAKQKNHFPLVDGGDILFFGQKVFVGVNEEVGMGCNFRGAAWLQTILGSKYEVITARLGSSFYHLDVVLSAPREGLIVVAPEAFLDGVPAYFDDWDKIEITGEQAMHSAANGLPVDPENYILGYNQMDDMQGHKKRLEQKGITVHLVDFGEHNKREGSIRCATQQLLRVKA